MLAVTLAVPAVAVGPTSDLGITKVTSNPTPTAGGAAFSYTIVISNTGPNDALGIVMHDPLPPGVIFHNVAVVNNPSIAGYGLICSGPPVATNGTVTCTGNLPGSVMPPSNATITIVGQIIDNVASGVRTNTATVISNTVEATPNTALNSASVQQNIVVNAPLSVQMSGPGSFSRGANVVYKMDVLNGGSSTALNATVTIPLPSSLSFLSMYGTRNFHNGCTVNPTGTITCAAVDIPSGLSTLTIVAKSAANTPLGNLATTATITTAGTGTIAVGTSTTTATVNP